MDHDEHRGEHEELVALHALELLEGEELERLEEHLATGCPQCRRELARRRGEVAALAEAVAEEEPAEGAREALLQRIEHEAPRQPPRTLSFPAAEPEEPAPAASRGQLWWLGLAATLLIAALAWGLASQRALHGEIDRLEARNRSLQADLDRSAAELAAVRTRLTSTQAILRTAAGDPVAVLAGLDAAAGARARVYRDRRGGKVLLVVDGLPPAPEGRVYELWGIVDGKPRQAGIFDTGSDGDGYLITELPAETGEVEVWTVTEEPAGGVPQPTGTRVLES